MLLKWNRILLHLNVSNRVNSFDFNNLEFCYIEWFKKYYEAAFFNLKLTLRLIVCVSDKIFYNIQCHKDKIYSNNLFIFLINDVIILL